MDVFSLRNGIINDYSDYVGSFINIKDPRIMEKVDTELKAGLLWPEPLLQLNPNFMPGASINDLTAKGTLHEMCSKVFGIIGRALQGEPLDGGPGAGEAAVVSGAPYTVREQPSGGDTAVVEGRNS
ncbi:MAG: hypothetical protein AB2L14_04980 [Candidatus Xenobiia bacterium LiM19]